MAAYAALVSLMNTMDCIQNHRRYSIFLNSKHIMSLGKSVGFLLDFVEEFSHRGSKEAEVLEKQIARAAYVAEDVIESHVVNRILAESRGHVMKNFNLFDLRKVVRDMDSTKKKVVKFKEQRVLNDQTPAKCSMSLLKVKIAMDYIKTEVVKFKDKIGLNDQKPNHSTHGTSSIRLTRENYAPMVGFDDNLIQLMEGLTGQQSNLKIVPIVGMGGIGKTTLARNVYENLLIVQHFDIRAWVTISQQYNVREILLQLLFCQRKRDTVEKYAAFCNEMDQKTEDEIGEILYKGLCSRRYLIILDDMWSIEAWEKIKYFFPDYSNRSRIVITTRLSDMATQLGSSCLVMSFLDEDKSWDLFCAKAFPQESCPRQLEKIGKENSKKCKGLPLSIVLIGGLLGKSPRTQEYWEDVAENINSILSSGEFDEQCLNILSLSYWQLPVHLKPCFLYMGCFREDEEILVSRLIKLWIAEGFLRPKKDQSLEDVGEDFLHDLIDRNLILARRLGLDGKIKTCIIHDLLREVCLKVAHKEKFRVLRVTDNTLEFTSKESLGVLLVNDNHPEDESLREEFLNSLLERKDLSVDDIISIFDSESNQQEVFHALQSTSHLTSDGGHGSFEFRLLRVLNVADSVSLESIFQQVNFRYIAYEHSRISTIELPSSISLLWNLQTLIIRGCHQEIVAPSEIWEMTQLRHLECDLLRIPDHPNHDQRDDFVLPNLQTLLNISIDKLNEEVCMRIPNMKKLHINYRDFPGEFRASSYHCLNNLGHLSKLESLKCAFIILPNRRDLLCNLKFPTSLQKLCLDGCNLHWEDLTMIGLLPNLEVVKLKYESVMGPEWDPVEGEFLKLKYLKIEYCNELIYWNADSSHFPVLENLVLCGLSKLDEVPIGIGDIPTLRLIRLDRCSASAASSAMRIQEEQKDLGNDDLQVRIWLCNKSDEQASVGKIESTGELEH